MRERARDAAAAERFRRTDHEAEPKFVPETPKITMDGGAMFSVR
jgi:hypothetical protein